jgi:hypothetical protein
MATRLTLLALVLLLAACAGVEIKQEQWGRHSGAGLHAGRVAGR